MDHWHGVRRSTPRWLTGASLFPSFSAYSWPGGTQGACTMKSRTHRRPPAERDLVKRTVRAQTPPPRWLIGSDRRRRAQAPPGTSAKSIADTIKLVVEAGREHAARDPNVHKAHVVVSVIGEDEPGSPYVEIMEFPSYEDAMRTVRPPVVRSLAARGAVIRGETMAEESGMTPMGEREMGEPVGVESPNRTAGEPVTAIRRGFFHGIAKVLGSTLDIFSGNLSKARGDFPPFEATLAEDARRLASTLRDSPGPAGVKEEPRPKLGEPD